MTTKFEKGDRVRVANDAAWLDGTVTAGVLSIRGTIQTFNSIDQDGDASLEGSYSVAPRYLTLVAIADDGSVTVPAPAISREQWGAWIRIEDAIGREAAPDMEDLGLILTLLPTELTNGPKLPEEPGFYLDAEKSVWHLMEGGLLFRVEDGEPDARMFGPFVKLGPARATVTADQIKQVVGYGALGDREVEALVALANGPKV